MKNLTVKKLVTLSIAILSGLLLIIGLAFNTIFAGVKGASSVGFGASGFAMLSFAFPIQVEAFIRAFITQDSCQIIAVIFGILSLLTLLIGITIIICNVLFIFREFKKAKKITTTLFIVAVVLAVVYSVVTIITTIVYNNALPSNAGVSYSTNMWITMIFQTLCLIAYIICAKKVSNRGIGKYACTAISNDEVTSTTKVNVKTVSYEEILSEEKIIVELLKDYKKLYDESIISTAEFNEKKAKLLLFTEKVIKVKLSNVKSIEIGKAEKTVVELIRDYKKLYDDGILSSADFMEKKCSLLTYIIS